MVKLSCERCRKEYFAHACHIKQGAKFCSRECYFKRNDHISLSAFCDQCGKEYFTKHRHIKSDHPKFCSVACRYLGSRTKILVACQKCGKEFMTPPSCIKKGESKYCSRDCASKASRKDVVESFWSKVEKTESCWNWTAALFESGYGAFGQWKAHRFSYTLHYGAIPKGLCVCHSCDNKKCQNPDHFFLGTYADNNRDRHNKGRDAKGITHGTYTKPEKRMRGTRNGNSKFAEKDIIEIRKLYATTGQYQEQIADLYNVAQSTIGNIVRRKTWAHIV